MVSIVCHCGLVGSAPTWDGIGCEFNSWQCRIYIPCSLSLRLLGSLRGSLGTYGLTQKLCYKKISIKHILFQRNITQTAFTLDKHAGKHAGEHAGEHACEHARQHACEHACQHTDGIKCSHQKFFFSIFYIKYSMTLAINIT